MMEELVSYKDNHREKICKSINNLGIYIFKLVCLIKNASSLISFVSEI